MGWGVRSGSWEFSDLGWESSYRPRGVLSGTAGSSLKVVGRALTGQ